MSRVIFLVFAEGPALLSATSKKDDDQVRPGRITKHDSAAELPRLIEAAQKAVNRDGSQPELVVMTGTYQGPSRKREISAFGNATQPLELFGEPGRDRTDDPLIKSQMLYH